MEGGHGNVNEEVKSGGGSTKKIKLEHLSGAGGGDNAKAFPCPVANCGKRFKTQRWLTRHLSEKHSQIPPCSKLRRRSRKAPVPGGGDGTADMVTHFSNPEQPPPSTTIDMDDENEGNGKMEIPQPVSLEEGTGVTISLTKENQDGSGGVPVIPTSSSAQYVEDGQTPGTSAGSILEMNREVRLERQVTGSDVEPTASEFDEPTLTAWIDEQRQSFFEPKKELQNGEEWKKSAQATISEQNVQIFNLEAELGILKEKLEGAEKKLEEAEQRQNLSEEKLLRCQRRNKTMLEFVYLYKNSQNAQRRTEEMAKKALEDFNKN